eukprot:TRINITY_DN916_c0_g1_i12.p1 TRINITY_DN916_c0_g1~~TRINITY_DN916_c0_g1_i12.p1  ORF type:complete len:142 (+),score=16.69 TRINITY_DN916_c0_g1_i12:55-426(+)
MQLTDILREDEIAQLPYVMGAWGFVTLVQFVLNRLRVSLSHSQLAERSAHYTSLLGIIILNMALDSANSDISFQFMTLKGIIGGYWMGVLDFYFSPFRSVSLLETIPGVLMWMLGYYWGFWCF